MDPEALHVTLCFLGWRDGGEVGRIGDLVVGAAGSVRDLGLGEAVDMLLEPRQEPLALRI